MKCNFENCGYYTDGECNICGMGISGEDTFCRLCKDNPKCYYKQLKRLQQEYVNLSKSFEHLQSSYLENQEYCLQLKAENKELAHYLACMTEQRNKANTYLQEIKAIAEKLYYTDLCENKKSLDEILDEVHEILQKINGAEIK